MSLTHTVYLRKKGESKKVMIAKFGNPTDALNYAYDQSRGRYFIDGLSIIVNGPDGRVWKRCDSGVVYDGRR